MEEAGKWIDEEKKKKKKKDSPGIMDLLKAIRDLFSKILDNINEKLSGFIPFIMTKDSALTREEMKEIVKENSKSQIENIKERHEKGIPEYESPTTEMKKDQILVSGLSDIEKVRTMAAITADSGEIAFIKINDDLALKFIPEQKDAFARAEAVNVCAVKREDGKWIEDRSFEARYGITNRKGHLDILESSSADIEMSKFLNEKLAEMKKKVEEIRKSEPYKELQDRFYEKSQEIIMEYSSEDLKNKKKMNECDSRIEQLKMTDEFKVLPEEPSTVFERDYQMTRQLCREDRDNVTRTKEENVKTSKNEKDEKGESKEEREENSKKENPEKEENGLHDPSLPPYEYYQMVFKVGKDKGLSPYQVVMMDGEEGIDRLLFSREKLVAKMDKYPKNEDLIRAIDYTINNYRMGTMVGLANYDENSDQIMPPYEENPKYEPKEGDITQNPAERSQPEQAQETPAQETVLSSTEYENSRQSDPNIEYYGENPLPDNFDTFISENSPYCAEPENEMTDVMEEIQRAQEEQAEEARARMEEYMQAQMQAEQEAWDQMNDYVTDYSGNDHNENGIPDEYER